MKGDVISLEDEDDESSFELFYYYNKLYETNKLYMHRFDFGGLFLPVADIIIYDFMSSQS